MANTYHQVYLQTVFAVKYRNAVMDPKWRHNFFAVPQNLINETVYKTIIAGGVEDHVHCFLGCDYHVPRIEIRGYNILSSLRLFFLGVITMFHGLNSVVTECFEPMALFLGCDYHVPRIKIRGYRMFRAYGSNKLTRCVALVKKKV